MFYHSIQLDLIIAAYHSHLHSKKNGPVGGKDYYHAGDVTPRSPAPCSQPSSFRQTPPPTQAPPPSSGLGPNSSPPPRTTGTGPEKPRVGAGHATMLPPFHHVHQPLHMTKKSQTPPPEMLQMVVRFATYGRDCYQRHMLDGATSRRRR
jgi:hypothetical protein